MKLSSLLHPNLIQCHLRARTRDEALSEMAGLLVVEGGAVKKDDILVSLTEREKLGPFSMGKGIVFPHARLDAIQDFRIVLGTSAEGIDFKAPDGQKIRIVVMFIIPRKHSNLYLHAFAAFLNFFSSETHVNRVVESTRPADVIQYIENSGIRFRDSTMVKEVMTPLPPVLTPDNTVSEALEAMYLSQAASLPVVDGEQSFTGEISGISILDSGIRDHLRVLTHTAVLDVQGPFDEFLKHQGQNPIRSFVNGHHRTVQEDESLFEVSVKMVRWSVPSVYVLKGRRPVGILHLNDVLKKVTGIKTER